MTVRHQDLAEPSRQEQKNAKMLLGAWTSPSRVLLPDAFASIHTSQLRVAANTLKFVNIGSQPLLRLPNSGPVIRHFENALPFGKLMDFSPRNGSKYELRMMHDRVAGNTRAEGFFVHFRG